MYTDAEHAMPAEETDPVLGERLESNANALEVPPVWQTTMLACKQISDACRSNAEWAQMWIRGSTCNGQRKAILRFEATEAAGSVSADHLRCGARIKWGRCGVCLHDRYVIRQGHGVI